MVMVGEEQLNAVIIANSDEDVQQVTNTGENVQVEVDLMGPNKKRVMTDKICLITFAVTLVLWLLLGVYGYIRLLVLRIATSSPDEQMINNTELHLKDISDNSDNLSQMYNRIGRLMLLDLDEAKYVIIGSMLCTAIVSITYLLFLHWTAEITSWLSFILFGIPIFTGIVYCFIMTLSKNSTRIIKEDWLKISAQSEWFILTVVVTLILLIYIVLLMKNITKIKQGICLIKESSKVVRSKFVSILIAASTWLLHFLTAIVMLTILLSMSEGETRVFNGGNGTCKCHGSYSNLTVGNICEPKLMDKLCMNCTEACKSVVSNNPVLQFFIAYNIFAYSWLTAFLIHLTYAILGGSFAFTYFQKEKESTLSSTVLFPIWKIIRYHLGTLALGAIVTLMTGIVKIFQLISHHALMTRVLHFVFEHNKLKKKIPDPWVKIFRTKSLLILCRHTYITCVVFGTPFKDSAMRVLAAWKSNILGVCKVVNFILFLAQLGICTIVTTRSYLIIKNLRIQQNFGGIVPAIVIFVMSMMITAVFLSVCAIAAETIVIAFYNVITEGLKQFHSFPL